MHSNEFTISGPYTSRVTHEIISSCVDHLGVIADDSVEPRDRAQEVLDLWLGLQGVGDSENPSSLRGSLARLRKHRQAVLNLATEGPPLSTRLDALLTATDVVDPLGMIDLESRDRESFPPRHKGRFGDISPDSYTNRLARSLDGSREEDEQANRWFTQRLLLDAQHLGSSARGAMEALLDTGTLPSREFRGLSLADLASWLPHPAVAVVVMDALALDPHAFEPTITESDERLTIVGVAGERPFPPLFTDLTEDIAYHTARYLRRVEARGDGHPDLAAVRRPLEPIALRVLPDDAAADEVLMRLARARDVLRTNDDVAGRDAAIAARALACADAILALADLDRHSTDG